MKNIIVAVLWVVLGGLIVSTASAARLYYIENRTESLVRRIDPVTNQNVPEWYEYTHDKDKCHVFVGRGKKGEITTISSSCRLFQ